VKPSNVRIPFLLWIAAGLAVPVVVLVVLTTLMERGPEAQVAESISTAITKTGASSPTTLDAAEGSQTRVAVPPEAAARRRAPAPAPQQASVAAAPPPAAAPGTITIVGQLRDTSDHPIDTEVGRIGYRGAHVARAAETHGSMFRLEDLEMGPADLQCVVHGYRRQVRKITLRPGETEHHEDFVLDPEWFVDVKLVMPSGGKVDRGLAHELLPDGQFHFTVSEAPPPKQWIAGSLDAHRAGRLVEERSPNRVSARIKPEDFARLDIFADPPVHLALDVHGVVLASTVLDSRVDRATLVLPIDRIPFLRCSFTCVVLDRETGAPFPGAHATLYGPFHGNDVPGPIDADPSGRIRREDLLPGRYTLSLRGESPAAGSWSARTFRTFDLEPGETDLGTIALDASQHVRGRFVDEYGRPVAAGGSVRPVSMDDSMETIFAPELHVAAGAAGTFQRDGLAREKYALVVWGRPPDDPKGDLLGASVLVDLRDGSIDDLVVRLERAQPVRLHAESEEAKDFVYRIADARGVPLFHGQFPQQRLHWMAPGDYLALVGPDTDHLREIPFTHGTEAQTVEVAP
jgi:hypothetical protein